MSRRTAQSIFALEALEPRVLLSGEAALAVSGSGLEALPAALQQVVVATADATEGLPLIGAGLGEAYNPGAQLEGIFGDLGAAGAGSVGAWVEAVDARPDAAAVLSTDPDTGRAVITLELGAAGAGVTEAGLEQMLPDFQRRRLWLKQNGRKLPNI